jgi:outer membrane protein TolC
MLTHLGEAQGSERQAAGAAQRAVDLATRRYEQGAATYLDVVVAQTASLEARRSSVELATRHRRAAVQLVRALAAGGRRTNRWCPSPCAVRFQPPANVRIASAHLLDP